MIYAHFWSPLVLFNAVHGNQENNYLGVVNRKTNNVEFTLKIEFHNQ